jgi:hypothetical protein
VDILVITPIKSSTDTDEKKSSVISLQQKNHCWREANGEFRTKFCYSVQLENSNTSLGTQFKATLGEPTGCILQNTKLFISNLPIIAIVLKTFKSRVSIADRYR